MRVIVLSLLVVAISCAVEGAAVLAQDTPTNTVRSYLSAWNRRDADGLHQVFLPTARIAHRSGVMAVQPWIAEQVRMSGTEEIVSLDVAEVDATAVVLMHYTLDDNGVFKTGADAISLIRQDGVWRIAAIAWRDDQ